MLHMGLGMTLKKSWAFKIHGMIECICFFHDHFLDIVYIMGLNPHRYFEISCKAWGPLSTIHGDFHRCLGLWSWKAGHQGMCAFKIVVASP